MGWSCEVGGNSASGRKMGTGLGFVGNLEFVFEFVRVEMPFPREREQNVWVLRNRVKFEYCFGGWVIW